MADTGVDINQNIAQCLQYVHHIGDYTVINICNGTQAVIPWGAGDWCGFVALAAFILVMIAMASCLCVFMIGEMIGES